MWRPPERGVVGFAAPRLFVLVVLYGCINGHCSQSQQCDNIDITFPTMSLCTNPPVTRTSLRSLNNNTLPSSSSSSDNGVRVLGVVRLCFTMEDSRKDRLYQRKSDFACRTQSHTVKHTSTHATITTSPHSPNTAVSAHSPNHIASVNADTQLNHYNNENAL